MARLAADEMIDIVRDMLGGETSETMSATRILRLINQAYLELCSATPFDQLRTSTTITTSSGTATYELSTDAVLEIDDITDDTTNILLYTTSEHKYNQWTQGNTVSGTPIYWFINGVGSNGRWNVTFFPTPNATLTMTVSYTKKPTELTTSPAATSTVIPEAWDNSIIYRAAARGWAELGDPQRAKDLMSLIRENDRAAYRSSFQHVYTPSYFGSIVGKALR